MCSGSRRSLRFRAVADPKSLGCINGSESSRSGVRQWGECVPTPVMRETFGIGVAAEIEASGLSLTREDAVRSLPR